MAPVNTPDYRLNAQGLADYLVLFSAECEGYFAITLVRERGQGYNAVLHSGSDSPKIRLALVENPSDPNCEAGSTLDVSDIVERLFAGGQFSQSTAETVYNTLERSLGCVRLVIEKGQVVASWFHNGELWP